MKRIVLLLFAAIFLQTISPLTSFAENVESIQQKQKSKKKASKVKKDGTWDKRFKENKHKNDKWLNH